MASHGPCNKFDMIQIDSRTNCPEGPYEQTVLKALALCERPTPEAGRHRKAPAMDSAIIRC